MVLVPAASRLIQLATDASGRQPMRAEGLGSMPHTWETPMALPLLASPGSALAVVCIWGVN